MSAVHLDEEIGNTGMLPIASSCIGVGASEAKIQLPAFVRAAASWPSSRIPTQTVETITEELGRDDLIITKQFSP